MNGMERYFSHWRSFNATGKQLFQIRFLRSKIWEHPILSSECNFSGSFKLFRIYGFLLLVCFTVCQNRKRLYINRETGCLCVKKADMIGYFSNRCEYESRWKVCFVWGFVEPCHQRQPQRLQDDALKEEIQHIRCFSIKAHPERCR